MAPVRSLPVALAALIASTSCAGTSAPTTTIQSTTTTSSVATTTIPPSTTTTIRTFNIDYEIWVYDAFETTGEVAVDAACVATSNISGIREGARIVLRDDETDDVVSTSTLEAGRVSYDHSGPEIGETDHELFYFCEFPAEFRDVPIAWEGNYYIDLPVTVGSARSIMTGTDLINGRVGSLSNDVFENQRQAIRLAADG